MISLLAGLLIGILAVIGLFIYTNDNAMPAASGPTVPSPAERVALPSPIADPASKIQRSAARRTRDTRNATSKNRPDGNTPLPNRRLFSGADPKDPRILH
jgi:hypothetical protein